MQGSMGLMRGDPSDRSVPSIATRVAVSRAIPSPAITGAPCSSSCQPAMPADEVTPVKVQPAKVRVPAGIVSERGRYLGMDSYVNRRSARKSHSAGVASLPRRKG